jgi:hypothetical protein
MISGTHWIGWVDPGAGLEEVERQKFLTLPDSNSDPSVVQLVASRYTDCGTPATYSWGIAYLTATRRQ